MTRFEFVGRLRIGIEVFTVFIENIDVEVFHFLGESISVLNIICIIELSDTLGAGQFVRSSFMHDESEESAMAEIQTTLQPFLMMKCFISFVFY